MHREKTLVKTQHHSKQRIGRIKGYEFEQKGWIIISPCVEIKITVPKFLPKRYNLQLHIFLRIPDCLLATK